MTGSAYALPTDQAYQAEVLSYASFLLDFQQAVGDLSFSVHEATQQAINSFASLSNAAAGRGTPHALVMDDNQINAGNGNNLVAGNNGIVLVPVVGKTMDWVSGYNSGVVAAAQSAASGVISSGNAAIAQHLASAHPLSYLSPSYLFGNGQGYSINMDNNVIVGGFGSNVLIGNNALILQPV